MAPKRIFGDDCSEFVAAPCDPQHISERSARLPPELPDAA